jgi:hypothetical protein
MSTSYQDIDTRLAVVEDKIDFIMKLARVTKATPSALNPGTFYKEQISLQDLYREVKTSGSEILDKEPTNGSDSAADEPGN